MAPPSKRRSGHSRRAQYGQFTGYVLASIGALVGAVLLIISLFNPSAFGGVRGAANEVVAPAGEGVAVVRSESRSWLDSIAGYLQAGSQNDALKKEVELARIRLAEAEAIKQENARLKSLVDIDDSESEAIVISRVVGATAASTRRFAYLGVGSTDGVRRGMPVRSPQGFIGRVLEVSPNTSRVLLLTDSESVVPVRRATDDVVAFAEGRGDGLINIRLINLGINPLEAGDIFVTSGAGGFFRPGVAVAIVTKVNDDGAIARIISDPAETDFVAVEPVFQPETVRASQTPIEQALAAETED
ncbi:rod shape-determining protein MreC [Parerythrobacter aestuarii]|uniref:rod shape-determining protein MreC n=1 Tax=Parerythrobacter aestuarii TaxID=3020909 RepID=UPI0024DEF9E8|nr:rod shape-determining protein MreC [Parerythrobacter aestuarii]